LNPKKLISVNFSQLGRNMTMKRTYKFYGLPEGPKIPGFRALESKDVDEAFALLTQYLNKFDLAPQFTRDEFLHWFTPQSEVVNSFVVEQNGKIIAFSSFYTLPSSVMHHPTYKDIKAAYAFYNVPCDTIELKTLVTETLIAANNLKYDVFNALDLMDNSTFLESLKFGQGDGDLQYYLFNWKCPTIAANKIGLVLQ
jgi:glycylpeptide N-tetradecanoyltransferase